MSEETKPKCPFVFADGRKCIDVKGHEQYALNCGHLPPAPEEPTFRKAQASSTYGRRMPALATIAMTAMVLGASDPMGRPRAPRLDPMPPPPEDPPPLPPTMEAKGRHGRSGGTQPVPRAFYSSRLMPGEDSSANASFLVGEFAQKVARDKAALLAAKEKRARKARKRLGR